jgi:hypothetical protein
MPVPAGTADGDFLVAVVANAGTAGPATPTGWTRPYGASAGSGQFCSVFTAPYSAGLTRAFTNAASLAVAVCGAYYEAGKSVTLDGAAVATVNTTNNTTLPTGAPTTGLVAGDFEVLAYAWTGNAAWSAAAAAGSTRDLAAVNGTTPRAALGHNNTTSLGASTACVAFAQTLAASSSRKTGVGILLRSVIFADLSGAAAGSGAPDAVLSARRALSGAAEGASSVTADLTSYSSITYQDLTGASGGVASIGTAFLWSGGGEYGTAVWGATGVTVITGGPPPPGPKYVTGSATATATATAAVSRRRALTVATAGAATTFAVLSKSTVLRNLTGATAGAATTTAAPTRRRRIVAVAAGVATVAGAPTRRRSLTVASGGVASTTALLGRRRVLVAGAAGVGTAAGAVRARRVLTAAAAGKATTQGSVDKAGSVFRPLVGTSAGQATSAGVASRRRRLVAASAGSATILAVPSRRRSLTVSVVGQATVTAAPSRRKSLLATSAGRATASGVISAIGAGVPLTSVIWVDDHFEMGTIVTVDFRWTDGTLWGESGTEYGSGSFVLWGEGRFQRTGDHPQVVWEDDVFKEAEAVGT